jgi:hypothetical protein
MPHAAEEISSRKRCNRLIARASKMTSGKAFELKREDVEKLTAQDRQRLMHFVHHELHQLAATKGRHRVEVPGPGSYHDGLRQSSARAREHSGYNVPRFVPEFDRFTDDLKASRAKDGPQELPPIATHSARQGPAMGFRCPSPEDRWRREHANVGPGLYSIDAKNPHALPATMKFRNHAAAHDARPGPGMYDVLPKPDRPSNLMQPPSRVHVQATFIPGPGAYAVKGMTARSGRPAEV